MTLPADLLGVRGSWSAAAEDKLVPIPPLALPLPLMAPGELEKDTRPTPMSRMVSAKVHPAAGTASATLGRVRRLLLHCPGQMVQTKMAWPLLC